MAQPMRGMDASTTDATDVNAAQSFAELFPPLVSSEPSALERRAALDVDISTDDIFLRPLEKEVDVHLYEALQRWNDAIPTSGETTMPYMQRLRRYRAIVRWILYENDDPSPDDEALTLPTDDADHTETTERRRLRQQRKMRQRLIAKYKHIFSALPPIELLREARRPPDRVAAFLAKFPIKKKLQQTKRSAADTQTSLCFDFAQRQSYVDSKQASDQAGGGDEDATPSQEEPEIQRPTATTAATWRSRTLLASVEEQKQADEALEQPEEPKHELLMWFDVLHASKDPAKTQSFLVLGSQRVHELLDNVVCSYDQRFASHNRHAKLLYYDNMFYVDRREPMNVDYATNILGWIYAKPSRVVKYLGSGIQTSVPVKTLETTTFAELALKMDMPAVYIHQGECEHLVRLRDARLYNPSTDSANTSEDFPLRLPNTHTRQLRTCMICTNYSAKFVCYGDRMSISDPMLFCERCYKTAHFDAQGQLIYSDFQAFPYIQE